MSATSFMEDQQGQHREAAELCGPAQDAQPHRVAPACQRRASQIGKAFRRLSCEKPQHVGDSFGDTFSPNPVQSSAERRSEWVRYKLLELSCLI